MYQDCKIFHDKSSPIETHGSSIMPGMLSAMVKLGLEEIASESNTANGNTLSYIRAVDGLRPGWKDSKELTSAYRAGIFLSVSAARGKGVVKGVPTAFYIGASDFKDAVVKEVVGFHFAIGNEAKGEGIESSLAGQMAELRETLKFSKEDVVQQVRSGSIPLIVNVIRRNYFVRFVITMICFV